MERVILHCDLNGFYASVECRSNPALRQVPMAVGGDAASRHGIILAKNELAKAYGVKTAETIWQAKQKCPDLVIVPPHHSHYRYFSHLVNEIYHRFTDQVEPFGIDESWLDVTNSQSLFGDGETIAQTIRHTVKAELDLTISVGVSFNKIFAKLGSDHKKPDAVTIISRENYQDIVFPKPVTDLLFVGEATAKKLAAINVKTIGQLAALPPDLLSRLFGKHGEQLYRYANGLDEEPVRRPEEREGAKSIGNGITFRRNLQGWDDIKTGVLALSETVAARLRQEGLQANGLQVAVKDPAFRIMDRQKPFSRPTNLTQEIYDQALEILSSCWEPQKPIRLLTITAIRLQEEGSGEQLDFFHPVKKDKWAALNQSLDSIRDKYGKRIVQRGRVVKNDLGIRDRYEDDPPPEKD